MREEQSDEKQDQPRSKQKPTDRDSRKFDKRTEGDSDNPLICRGQD